MREHRKDLYPKRGRRVWLPSRFVSAGEKYEADKDGKVYHVREWGGTRRRVRDDAELQRIAQNARRA
jgi:hypothetical protein